MGRKLVLALLGAVVLSGCAQQVAEETPPPTQRETVVSVVASDLPALPHARVRGDLPEVTADENRITVGTRRVDVAPLRADHVVSTRGGVYFLNAGELWFLAGHGAHATGYSGVERMVTSADGRYLGFVDRNHGPAIGDGAPLAAAVVYDTRTGEVRLRSYAGMGRLSAQLARTYAAMPPTAIGFDGPVLLARTPSGTWRYPTDGVAPTEGD